MIKNSSISQIPPNYAQAAYCKFQEKIELKYFHNLTLLSQLAAYTVDAWFGFFVFFNKS